MKNCSMNTNNVNKFPSRGRRALVCLRRNNGRAAAAATRRRLNQSLRFEEKVDVYDDPSRITCQEQEDYWYTTDELNEMKSMKLHVDDYDCEDLKCIGHTTTCAIQAQQDALARAATMANEVHVYRSEYEIEETMKIIDEVLDMLQGDDLF